MEWATQWWKAGYEPISYIYMSDLRNNILTINRKSRNQKLPFPSTLLALTYSPAYPESASATSILMRSGSGCLTAVAVISNLRVVTPMSDSAPTSGGNIELGANTSARILY
jgi:hypothetical protein